ncbi:MAG: helix-turn-helix domain-containing protein [Candidatus Hodarchaeales archaeon]|jgi:predicted ArsR family transcriptional regulator
MTQYLQNSLTSKKENDDFDLKHSILSDNKLTNETDRIVLGALSEIQPTTRTELCKKTGIPRTTIYDALSRLILKKVVIKFSTPRKTKGRPKVFYRIA